MLVRSVVLGSFWNLCTAAMIFLEDWRMCTGSFWSLATAAMAFLEDWKTMEVVLEFLIIPDKW